MIILKKSIILLASTFSVNAADIPLESAPKGANAESVAITQNLMGYINEERQMLALRQKNISDKNIYIVFGFGTKG